MKSEIINIFTKADDIRKITDKLRNYSFDELDKHFHFEFSVMEKITDISKLGETFPRFDLIKSIELRKNEKGQRYYVFNYEIEDKTFVVIVLVLDRHKPLIINGFHAKTNYKKFEESLRRNYPDKFKQ